MQHRERRGRAALELALAYNAKLPGPAARLPLQDGVSSRCSRLDRSRYRACTRPHSAQLSVKPVLNSKHYSLHGRNTTKASAKGFFIMICNPTLSGELPPGGGGGLRGGSRGGRCPRPTLLSIYTKYREISRAKNPEGIWPRDRTGGAPMWVRSMEGLGVVFTEAKHCHRAR